MSKSIHLFATQSDWIELLSAVESNIAVKYVKAGMFDSSSVSEFTSHKDILDLGVAVSGDQVHNPSFLVLRTGENVNIETISQRRGGTRYAIDQRRNQSSVVLSPGGVYKSSFVIAGQIGTCTDDPSSLALLNDFIGIRSEEWGLQRRDSCGQRYRCPARVYPYCKTSGGHRRSH